MNRAGQGVVLVVDDDPLLLRVMKRILAREDEVITARSVDEALAQLEEAPERVDAALSDFMMPDRTGGDLVAEMKYRGWSLAGRTVLVSGAKIPADALPADIPLRTLAKPARGCSLTVHGDEGLQKELRKLAGTRSGRERLRERVGVEHRLAHHAQKPGTRARFLVPTVLS